MGYADPDARFVINRATIRMPYVPHARISSVASWPVVEPRSPMWLRRVVEQLARQFQRETHFDVPPYIAADPPPGQHVMLLPSSRRLVGRADLIAGAIGISSATEAPALAWAYVHPYERGYGLIDEAWPDVLRRYPHVRLDRDPCNTPAGNALLNRLLKHAVHP